MKKRFTLFFALLLSVLTVKNINAQDANIISDVKERAIDSLALEKISDLGKYIAIIGDKKTSFSEAQRVIDRALELFADGSQIGVSSINSENVKYFSIRKYFEHLMALNYDKVTIKWFNIQYVSNLEQQPDGRFVGVITIYQKFTGTTNEGLKYEDTTKKDITVYLEKKQAQISGRIIDFWDVLLGDIKVTETRK